MSPALQRIGVHVGRRSRLALVLVCLLLAAVSALESAHRAAPLARVRTAAVVVATRALAVGHLLTTRDVVAVRWPVAVRPAAAVADPHLLVGRRLAGPLSAREAITPGRLLGRDLTAGLGSDMVAVPVRLDTDVGRLVHAGDRVELIAVPRTDTTAPDGAPQAPAGAQLVAGGSRVLAVLEASGSASSAGSDGTQLVLAVHRPVALRIATLISSRLFTAVADDP